MENSIAKPIHEPVVSDLLSSLFRQTIYHRIENLLLDPGKKSTEKQKIIDSAVENYHQQKINLPTEEDENVDLTNLTGKSEIFVKLSKWEFLREMK